MFLSLIQKRRSTRRFQDKQVEAEKIDALIEAALRAPSSMGNRPWEFIVVEDRELLGKLSTAKQFGSAFLKAAPLGIVVCADPAKSDVWVEDASIASVFIHLAAASIGLGSCWIQIRERMHDDIKTSQSYISEILNIPENIRVEAIVAIGYPDEENAPHQKETLLFDRVYLDSYDRPYRQEDS
jgi:nitroreductase